MIKTHGLHHISLSVRDLEKSLAFYTQLFADIGEAVRQAKAFGAKILRQGEFGSDLPFVYIEDPDGYTIEIWFE